MLIPGPGVVISPRMCVELDRHGGLSVLRVQAKTDEHIAEQLEEIRQMAAAYLASSAGRAVAVSHDGGSLSTREVGDLLGVTSRAVVYAISRDEIPGAIKVGTSWRIDREEFGKYLASRT